MSRFFAVIFLTFFLESEALSISKETVAEPSEVLEPRTFSSEVVDLGATYDYLTNSDTSYLFLLVLAFQYVFAGVGWFITRSAWVLIRGDAVGSDPDFTGLADFLLSDQTATNMVALGVGYAIVGGIAWVAFSQLGSPSTASARSHANEYYNGQIVDNIVSYDDNINLLTEKTDPGFDLVAQLDNLFNLSTVMVVMLINSVLTAAFMAFWTGMRYLPPRIGTRHAVKRSTNFPPDLEQIMNIEDHLSVQEDIGYWKNLEY